MRQVWTLGTAGLALLLAACATAPEAPAAEPQPLSLVIDSPKARFNPDAVVALEAALKAYVDEGRVKGIATRLMVDGEAISEMRAGIRREADAAPVEDDTIWRIYSMSKPVTGVALLTLWEDGKFELDDPITTYFPEFETLQVFTGLDAEGQPTFEAMSRPPTVQELMSHTAGFGYGLAPGNYVDDRFQEAQVFQSPDISEIVRRVSTLPLKHQPGTTWDYSISVDLQAALIERLSGQRLGVFLKERLFDPLGMKDTGFYVPEAEYDRLSDVWAIDPANGKAGPLLSAPGFQMRKETIAAELGGHGLVSTLDDYSRFAMMLANEGSLDGVTILKPETVKMMSTNFLPEGVHIWEDRNTPDARALMGFGLDVSVMLADDLFVPKGSFMWGGAAGTWFWIDPANHLSFVGMIQLFGGSADQYMRAETAPLVYDAFEEKR